MATTRAELRTICYGLLREDEDTSAYPYVLMDLFLDASQQKICNGRVVNPLTKEEVRKWQLPFLFTDKFYSNIQSTYLSADLAVWATTINVTNASEYPTADSLYIGGNIITYTGTTATSFTWCSWVAFAFKAGIEVSIAYQLPTDYASPINIVYNNRFQLPMQLYDDIFENLNSYKGWNGWQHGSSTQQSTSPFWPFKVNPFYSIKDNKNILIYNLPQTWAIVRFRYSRLPAQLSASVDASIPNDIYAKTTIPYLAVAEMLYNRWEEGRAAEIINFGIWQIREMYTYYDDSMYQEISGTQYKTAKRWLNI